MSAEQQAGELARGQTAGRGFKEEWHDLDIFRKSLWLLCLVTGNNGSIANFSRQFDQAEKDGRVGMKGSKWICGFEGQSIGFAGRLAVEGEGDSQNALRILDDACVYVGDAAVQAAKAREEQVCVRGESRCDAISHMHGGATCNTQV
jgi:hypothetical protein